MAGKLYVVATPMGNLGDITYRAVEILSNVASIAAEDTRHSQRLLQHYQITTTIFALNDHNEMAKSEMILSYLQQGDDIALISDAGTPLISDPGFHLINFLRQHGIDIIPIPGPCAAIAALSAAGLPTDQFYFVGFLPAKTKARQHVLEQLCAQTATLIFYEAPHRIVETLQDMVEIFGVRQAVIAREMTKTYETIKAGSLIELLDFTLSDDNQQRGEFVVLVHGYVKTSELTLESQRIMRTLAEELPINQAAKLASQISGAKKNVLYEWWLAQSRD